LSGQKVVELSELTKPDMVLARHDRLFVLERTSVYIYSLKDFQLIRKFGREGEGPQEFRARRFGPPMTLSFYYDNLVVNSDNKLSYFSLKGDFLREEKTPPNTVFYKVKNGYLGIGSAIDGDNGVYISFRLFDNKFSSPKMLYQTEINVGQLNEFKLPMNALNYFPINGDYIFVVNGKQGFVIDFFNYTGKKIFTIQKKEFEKIKVTDSYKKETHNWFKNHPVFKPIYTQIKPGIKFKEYYPAIKTFSVDKNNIYVVTNKTKKSLFECIIMDLKGNEKKRFFLPLQDGEPYTYYPLLCDFNQGKYYALLENEDEETWELYLKDLND
jgi:hypothetical protein